MNEITPEHVQEAARRIYARRGDNRDAAGHREDEQFFHALALITGGITTGVLVALGAVLLAAQQHQDPVGWVAPIAWVFLGFGVLWELVARLAHRKYKRAGGRW